MSLVHHLADDLVVTSFKGVAHVKDSLNLSDDIFSPEKILRRNLLTNLLKPNSLGVAEELYITVVLSDGGTYVLARLTSLVVC